MVKKTKEPSTELIPTSTLVTISNELLAVQQKLIDQGGEIQEGDFEALEKWNGALEEKAENICHVLMKMEHEATYYESLAKAARARAETLSKTDKRLRQYLAGVMAATGTKSIKQTGGLFTISLVAGRASVVIADEKKLPLDRITVEVIEKITPKKKEIQADIESGKEVPGATLEYGANYLVIRS